MKSTMSVNAVVVAPMAAFPRATRRLHRLGATFLRKNSRERQERMEISTTGLVEFPVLVKDQLGHRDIWCILLKKGSICASCQTSKSSKESPLSGAHRRLDFRVTQCLHFVTTNPYFGHVEQIPTSIFCVRANLLWEFPIRIVFNGRREMSRMPTDCVSELFSSLESLYPRC